MRNKLHNVNLFVKLRKHVLDESTGVNTFGRSMVTVKMVTLPRPKHREFGFSIQRRCSCSARVIGLNTIVVVLCTNESSPGGASSSESASPLS